MSVRKFEKSLSESVEDMVAVSGGWLHILGALCPEVAPAISKLGRGVDCPFPERHGAGKGKGSFRLSEKPSHAGRAICSCNQETGWAPLSLISDIRGISFMDACFLVRDHLRGGRVTLAQRKVVETAVQEQPKDLNQVVGALRRLASGMLSIDAPESEPLRKYFANRGFPVTAQMGDIRFHPNLKVLNDAEEEQSLPGVCGAFKRAGKVVAFHRILITSDGRKAALERPKRVYSQYMPDWSEGHIEAYTTGSRDVLNITEGIEKAWAIGSFTGKPSIAAYSCGVLPKLDVPDGYSQYIIWADNDPVIPGRKREVGDGQYFARKLAERLAAEGKKVVLMVPKVDRSTDPVSKGPDWEDIILTVKQGYDGDMPSAFRMPILHALAEKGGEVIHKQEVSVA